MLTPSARPPSSTTHASSSASPESICLRGLLKNFNTIEEFKDASKPELLQPLIDSLAATLSPSSGGDGPSSAPELSPFLLLTFADLKKFRFFYWFAFPGVVQKPAWEVTDAGWSEPVEPEEERALREAIASRRSQRGDDSEGAFLLRKSESGMPLVASLHEFRSFFDGLPCNEVRDPSECSLIRCARALRLTLPALNNHRSARSSSTTHRRCSRILAGLCVTRCRTSPPILRSATSRSFRCAEAHPEAAAVRECMLPHLPSKVLSRPLAGSGTRRVSSDRRWSTCLRRWIPSGACVSRAIIIEVEELTVAAWLPLGLGSQAKLSTST